MNTTLFKLSPLAAKLYLALHTFPGADQNPPIAQASLISLAAHTNLCKRSCSHALRQLLDLKLITRLPKIPRQPSRYQLHPLPDPHPPATLNPSNAHPHATRPPSDAHPAATHSPPNAHATATPIPKTPIPTPKTPNAHPAATNITFTPTEEALLSNPTFLKLLMSTLSPSQNTHLIKTAQSTLARLNAKEAHQ